MISALGLAPSTPHFDTLSQSPSRGVASAAPVVHADFGTVLKSYAASAIDTLHQGEAAAAQGILGTLPVQQVVDQVMAAERTLQATIAVRDKLVSAWQEISRMQI